MVDKTKKPRTNNLVAKHARKYNKSNVMTDRKKAEKRGYKKHSKDVRTQEGVAVESLDNAKSEKDSAQIKLRHANQKVRLAKRQEREKQMKEEFAPHDMYHPETGEKKHAPTKATHLVLKAKGWSHNPKEEIDSAAKKPEKYTKTDGTVGMRMVPAHKKIANESIEQTDEAYFSVHFRDEKGKADSSSKKFKSASAAKKYTDNANKTTKVGSYVMNKVQGRMESVEQVDEGVLNDIRDFIVAVGAALPITAKIKKNKLAKQDKVLEDQIRSAMQRDPEFDKLVRNVVFVRKDGVAAFKNGGKAALAKYVAKTVDSATAKKLGTLQTRWMKVEKDGTVSKTPSSLIRTTKSDLRDPTKHKNVEDMNRTHVRTTERISKIIKQVAARAAHAKNIKEEVEQVDEAKNPHPMGSIRVVNKKGHELHGKKVKVNRTATGLAKKGIHGVSLADGSSLVGHRMQSSELQKESVEQVDELSKRGLKKYINRARSDRDDAQFRSGTKSHYDQDHSKEDERGDKRDRGINLARAKTNKGGRTTQSPIVRAKVRATESVEQVQESTGHVRMDRLSKSSQQKVINVLNVHKKNGSIDYDGTTDKGVSLKLKKPEHHSKIHSDLRKHGTGFDMHESVEQVDENMSGHEGKNKIKFHHSDAKVHKNAVDTFPDHHKAEFDKMKNTTTIHLKKSVDKDTASKVGRFNSNWRTRSTYHESTDYEDVIAEALSDVVVKKMQDMVGGADKMPRGAEFRKLKAKAQAAVKAERAGKKAEPKAQTTTKTAKGRVHKGSADAADRNLIMQLRKAQDIDGKMDIQVSPAGRTIRLSKKQIDMFLAKHDSLAKPVDKRKFKILLTKALRSKAK
jgi:hypothetical protein